mgnify:FL=1
MNTITDDQLKEIARTILIDTARYNYQMGLEVEVENNNLSEEQEDKLSELINNATIKVEFD